MAEIKSTLEIALERAAAFDLSDEDRKNYKIDELNKKVSAVLFRYLEGDMAKEDVKMKLAELEEEKIESPEKLLIEKTKGEIRLEKVILDDRNGRLLKLIKYLTGADISPVTETLNAFQSGYRTAVNSRIGKMKKHLKKKRGISGTAVIPHIDIDPKWKTEKKKLLENYEERLYKSLETI